MFEAILQFHINFRKVRKRAKSCENMCFSIDTLKKDLSYKAITLQNPWEKFELSQYFANSSVLALPSVGGNSPLTNTVQIREMWFISPYFREKVLLRNAQYFADIIRTWYSQLLAIPVFANPADVHLDAQRRQWAWDEVLGVQHLLRRAKWLSAQTGCLSTACHNFSAGEHNTLSWTQNSSGNLHARIYSP